MAFGVPATPSTPNRSAHPKRHGPPKTAGVVKPRAPPLGLRRARRGLSIHPRHVLRGCRFRCPGRSEGSGTPARARTDPRSTARRAARTSRTCIRSHRQRCAPRPVRLSRADARAAARPCASPSTPCRCSTRAPASGGSWTRPPPAWPLDPTLSLVAYGWPLGGKDAHAGGASARGRHRPPAHGRSAHSAPRGGV